MANKAYQIAFNGAAVEDDFYGDVASLTVEEGTGSPNSFRLQLTSRLLEDGSWAYLDDDRLSLFHQVSIKIGFVSGGGLGDAIGSLLGGGSPPGLSPVFDGYITSADLKLDNSPANTILEIAGMDTGILMSLEEKMAVWPDLSDSDIAQQILGSYNVDVHADPTPTVHKETDTTTVQRGSDIQFVQELARRNGMEFYFETDATSGNVTAHFEAPQLSGTPQPVLAIHFGDETNLRTFSVRLNGYRPLNVKTQQMDVRSNGPNSAQVGSISLAKLGDKDATALIGGPLGSLISPQDAPAQMLVLGPPTSDATELNTVAQAVRDEAGWLIQATGEVNSDAYQMVLRPHRLVLVKGAGNAFSGKYYVTRVRHEIRSDGSYVQKFDARRNARDVDGTEQFGGGGSGLPIPGI